MEDNHDTKKEGNHDSKNKKHIFFLQPPKKLTLEEITFYKIIPQSHLKKNNFKKKNNKLSLIRRIYYY